jgi:mono/diheme cytochrome c family protein
MKKVMKWIGIGVGGLAVLLLAVVGGIFGFSSIRMNKTYSFKPDEIRIATDAASIERGRHFAVAIAKCTDCHGPDLSGKVFIDDKMMGKLIAPNLTSGQGGVGAKYDDAKHLRVLRHGVKQDGHPALFMPSQEYVNLNEQDLANIIAYVRSVPPVDNVLPSTDLKLLPRVLYIAGVFPLLPVEMIKHSDPRPVAIAPGPTAEYGAYLARVGGCKGCHGEKLNGGRVPGTPPSFPSAQNLTPAGIGDWTEADFTRALRVGVRKDGTKIDPFMPWAFTTQMTDDEIHATWLYLKTLPSVPTPKS